MTGYLVFLIKNFRIGEIKGDGLVSKALVAKYEFASLEISDANDVRYQDRLGIFLEVLRALINERKLPISVEAETTAKFLYFSYWFRQRRFDFDAEIAKERIPFESTFFRIDLMWGSNNILAADANYIAWGIEGDFFLRAVMIALIVEATRRPRLLRAMELRRPISLAKYNMLLSALELSPSEYSIHQHFTRIQLEGESAENVTRCQLGFCGNEASWVVLCPHGDGREFLCHSHKSQDDLSFETYRLVFSTSCRHHADRRDCQYVMISLERS